MEYGRQSYDSFPTMPPTWDGYGSREQQWHGQDLPWYGQGNGQQGFERNHPCWSGSQLAPQSGRPTDGYPDYPANFEIDEGWGSYAQMPGFDKATVLRNAEDINRLREGEKIIDRRWEEAHFVRERLVDEQWRQVRKPYRLVEKIYEVPEVIVRETLKEVPKPEIVERVIEVPKIEQFVIHQPAPARKEVQERIVEVPQYVVEEHIVHVPKVEVQERIFEIPVPEFREVIEYDDRIEYREVPVDKIVEVPEIEYRIKEVETLVPQTYIQNGRTRSTYVEYPVAQVQEVQRHERVPFAVENSWPSWAKGPCQQSSMFPGMPGNASLDAVAKPLSASQNMYASYEPIKAV